MARFAKKNVTDLEGIDKWLANERKIRFKKLRSEKVYSILEIFEDISRDGTPGTVYVKGSEHTEPNRARSLHDIVLISKYYNPELSYMDIMLEIAGIYRQKSINKELGKSFSFCPDIKKYNFRSNTYLWAGTYNSFVKLISWDLQKIFPNLHNSNIVKHTVEERHPLLNTDG